MILLASYDEGNEGWGLRMPVFADGVTGARVRAWPP